MTRCRQRTHKFDNVNRPTQPRTNNNQYGHGQISPKNENDLRDLREYEGAGDHIVYLKDEYGGLNNYGCNRQIPPYIIHFIVRQLVYSRIFLFIFQCTINLVMRDHVTDAFKGIRRDNEERGKGLIWTLFSGLCRWDAQHFLHIAEFGYIWESSLAFFPLFPTILRVLGSILQQMAVGMISLQSAMIIAGTALNNTLFLINGLLLFRLTLLLNGANLKEAILVVYIHCWCPASIFYSALYTESLYATFTLFGLLHLYSSPQPSRQNLLVTSAIFSYAFLTRSNGLTNIGYIGYQLLLDTILIRKDTQKQPEQWRFEFRGFSHGIIKQLTKNFLFFALCFAIMSLHLRVFEFIIHEKFCLISANTSNNFLNPLISKYIWNGTNNREIVLPGDLANMHWCNESFSISSLFLPAFYQHVQQHYWDVGLFTYWQWRKSPLFLMAMPTLGVALYGACKQTFGLLSFDLRPVPDVLADKCSQIPFACHAFFLTLSGLIFYNVEVSIRLLFSSSPFIYIVIARSICARTPEKQQHEDLMDSQIIPFLRSYMRVGLFPFLTFCYLFGFFIFGTMLHVNWLPFV